MVFENYPVDETLNEKIENLDEFEINIDVASVFEQINYDLGIVVFSQSFLKNPLFLLKTHNKSGCFA